LVFYFCKGFQQFDLQKATRLTQDLVWVFAARKITFDAEIFDSLRIEAQRGLSFEAQTALDAPNLVA
jgi:hypothetical protein